MFMKLIFAQPIMERKTLKDCFLEKPEREKMHEMWNNFPDENDLKKTKIYTAKCYAYRDAVFQPDLPLEKWLEDIKTKAKNKGNKIAWTFEQEYDYHVWYNSIKDMNPKKILPSEVYMKTSQRVLSHLGW